MPLPVRRVLAGFAAGAAAGWFAGLLRTPETARADSSAGAALRLPQREFGDPAGAPTTGLAPGGEETDDARVPPVTPVES